MKTPEKRAEEFAKEHGEEIIRVTTECLNAVQATVIELGAKLQLLGNTLQLFLEKIEESEMRLKFERGTEIEVDDSLLCPEHKVLFQLIDRSLDGKRICPRGCVYVTGKNGELVKE